MLTRIRKTWRNYQALTGARRELATFGLCLAVGLTLLPALIWVAGRLTLGEYVRSPSGTPTGGPLALWVDYLSGLAHGSVGYWVALLGPWVLLLALRASSRLLRR